MVHKTYFALAVVFLVVVVAAPIVILSMQGGYSFGGNIIIQNPSGMDTVGDLTFPIDEQQQEQRANTIIILAAVEAVFVLLFVVTLYYGLKNSLNSQNRVRDPKQFIVTNLSGTGINPKRC